METGEADLVTALSHRCALKSTDEWQMTNPQLSSSFVWSSSSDNPSFTSRRKRLHSTSTTYFSPLSLSSSILTSLSPSLPVFMPWETQFTFYSFLLGEFLFCNLLRPKGEKTLFHMDWVILASSVVGASGACCSRRMRFWAPVRDVYRGWSDAGEQSRTNHAVGSSCFR